MWLMYLRAPGRKILPGEIVDLGEHCPRPHLVFRPSEVMEPLRLNGPSFFAGDMVQCPALSRLEGVPHAARSRLSFL
jgi:hypothetical protein